MGKETGFIMIDLDAKIERWKKRLLDLGKRNTNLNFRFNKTSTFLLTGIKYMDIWNYVVEKEQAITLDFDEGDHYTPTNGKIFRNLKKRSQTFIEEQGINVLYLCIGFLNYKEGNSNYLAPLITVPIRLTCDSITTPYKLFMTDDEILVNPTLKFKLENDYNIKLPKFDQSSNPENYFRAVKRAIKNLDWTIDTKVAVGLLHFAKLNMYRDLIENHERIKNSRLINAIAGDQESSKQNLPSIGNLDDNELLKPVNNFQVVDADTSQQEAIIYAKSGVSFVLQGPPGTGKSQTITNIIAELLATGKKILFVSEKKAALNVVHNRLAEAGLSDFCLTMHNMGDSKLGILSQFRNVIEMADKNYTINRSAMDSLDQLERDREELNDYVEELHDLIAPLNKTIFEANAELSALKNVTNVIFPIKDIRTMSGPTLHNMLELIGRYVHSVSGMNVELEYNPWYGCNLTELTHEISHDIDFNFDKVILYITSVNKIIEDIKTSLGYTFDPSYSNICEAEKVLSLATHAEKAPCSWILSDELAPLFGEIDACNETKAKFIEIRNRIIELHQELTKYDQSLNFEDYNILSETGFINTHNEYISKIIAADSLYSLLAIGNANAAVDGILSELGSAINTYLSLKKKLSDKFEKEIFNINPNEILQRFKVSYSWGCFNFLKGQYRADKKLFKGLLRQISTSITDEEIIEALTDLKNFNDIAEQMDTKQNRYREILGDDYKRENTDIQDIERRVIIYRLILKCKNEIENLKVFVSENEAREDILKTHYENLYSGIETDWESVRSSLTWASAFKSTITNASENTDFIKKLCIVDKASIAHSEAYYQTISKWKSEYDIVYSWVKGLFDDGDSFNDILFPKFASIIKDCLDNKAMLQDWVDYRKILDECKRYNLKEFIDVVEKEHVVPTEIPLVFKKRFYELWLDQALATHPKVAKFRGKLQNDRIEEFKKLDRGQFILARARTRAILLNDLANHNIATNSIGELALLKKELNKKKRIMPIRKLFNAIPNLVMMLKPCLMMSPLTVSLYLQSPAFKFDAVIFDEASQVCTEDAIGAIIRGKQVIIAGDSKQLPPTNFFKASMDSDTDEYDDENEGNNDVYESLLDEAALLPVKTLLWHYRSKHEHLIAFSNRKIYNGRLITFPSNRELGEDVGVQYEYVADGFYDRGGRKGNVIEAEKVADLVFEHFRKCSQGIFNRSLGVITFGDTQAQAIEAALRKKREADPSLESYFSENLDAPFFIKSLENVQGDERDTIIFSIGYAKDANGVMHMAFGPLSQSGGERRLNVAITRAKFNVKLVGSILPSDIDVERVTTEGPKLLRSYIDFARRGIKALDTEVTITDSVVFDSPFEQSVYNFMIDHGYKVKTQVGCSSYRIDLAVCHPTLSGCFVLGVECDGATYHSAKNARERDRLRQDVLESMGWKIYRIWSTDWIKDPITEGKRLIEAIENAFIAYDFEKDPEIETIDLTPEEFVSEVEKDDANENNKYHFDDYPTFDNIKCYDYDDSIKEKVKEIVSLAYPLALDQLYRELCSDLGASRVTTKIKDKVDMAISGLSDIFEVIDGFVIPKSYDHINVHMASSRKIDYISPLELAEGIILVAKANIPMSKDELIMESVKAFGFNRKTQNILSAFDKAFEYLISTHRIAENNNKVEILMETPSSTESETQDLDGMA